MSDFEEFDGSLHTNPELDELAESPILVILPFWTQALKEEISRFWE
jgi:hypothetical protein